MQSLDDVFNGNEVEVTEEAAETTEEATSEVAEEPEVAEEAETETEEPTGEKETEDSTPEPKKQDQDDWKFAAYQDEKRKRQELEKQLEELKKTEQPENKPDLFEDPDGYQQYQQTQVDSKITNVKAQMSEFMAAREFGKERVESAFNKFSEMVQENPALYQKAINAVSPYHEIVEIVEKAEKFEKMQNVEQYEAQLRAEIEQKVRAELEAEVQAKSAKKSVTPSLNSQTSADGHSNAAVSDLSLNELFGR